LCKSSIKQNAKLWKLWIKLWMIEGWHQLFFIMRIYVPSNVSYNIIACCFLSSTHPTLTNYEISKCQD
jgi:hypothetical protein